MTSLLMNLACQMALNIYRCPEKYPIDPMLTHLYAWSSRKNVWNWGVFPTAIMTSYNMSHVAKRLMRRMCSSCPTLNKRYCSLNSHLAQEFTYGCFRFSFFFWLCSSWNNSPHNYLWTLPSWPFDPRSIPNLFSLTFLPHILPVVLHKSFHFVKL